MLLETPHFAVDLPEGYVVDHDDGTWSAKHAGELREVSVTARTGPADTPLDAVLESLAGAYRRVLRDNAGATEMSPLALSSQGKLRVASFMAEAPQPRLVFCALVSHEQAILEQRTVVTLGVYQYGERRVAPGDRAAFELAARSILATLEIVPRRAALQRSAEAGEEVDPSRVYPYLVPPAYLEPRSDMTPGAPRHLGHGMHIAVAEDFDGAARIHWPEGGPDDAWPLLDAARENLKRVVTTGEISVRSFEGPRGLPIFLFGHDWRAAGCLLLPNLHAALARYLGDGPLCASIPHRDILFLFRAEDADYRRAVRALIDDNEPDGRKPLTRELFSVQPQGIEPLLTDLR